MLIADITRINFNVTYEIGYAIGANKRILLLKNKSIVEGAIKISDIGIFDTIGYKDYENSTELVGILSSVNLNKPININYPKNQRFPVYLNDARFKNDWVTALISKVKKAKLHYRSFDPNEQSRLSSHEAIKQIAESYGVLIHLLSEMYEGHEIHNIWASFLAGLAAGMKIECFILQNGYSPVPIDCRDLVKSFKYPEDLTNIINDFAGTVTSALQSIYAPTSKKDSTFLENLDLGSSSAENEIKALDAYYLETDSYKRTSRGEIKLVVGRKGSGKTAIFYQLRDKLRQHKANVVLDLKPDGYILLKFKETVADLLSGGTFEHTISIFWEYILLLEICRKIIINDEKIHIFDPTLLNPYREIKDIYGSDGYVNTGDFSERINNIVKSITNSFKLHYGKDNTITLSEAEITRLIYNHDVAKLRDVLSVYLAKKESIWILVDNLDKGWPTHGIGKKDIVMIRTLLDSTRKIERLFKKRNIEVNTVVFLRNDVYDLLISETSDRGKESKAVIDWSDIEMIKELIRKRIVYNGESDKKTFYEIWNSICVSHINGEETSDFLFNRTLMRPRFVINLINQCKSVAVNRSHTKIEIDDIHKGLYAFSTDLLNELTYEIRDVYPEAGDILYEFLGAKALLTKAELNELLSVRAGLDKEKIIDILLWYGFLGYSRLGDDPMYIYKSNYDMRILAGFINKLIDTPDFRYAINPAFQDGLYSEKL